MSSESKQKDEQAAKDARLIARRAAKERWLKKRNKRSKAIKTAVKNAQDSLTARDGGGVALDYTDHLKDDFTSEILEGEPFLFLVDTKTGAGLLCEYVASLGWNAPGNYKQMYLSREDVNLLKKSTGIIPNYLNLRADMRDRPESITINLATLTMLKTLNLFKRVNADPEEQRDMLQRFIEIRTGRAVTVNTSDGQPTKREPDSRIQDMEQRIRDLMEDLQELEHSKTTLEKNQSTPQEQKFNTLFANTEAYAEEEDFDFAVGFLKSDTFLYTWENRNSYMPAFFATKGTTFKKGTVVLRSFNRGGYDRIVVIDARDYNDIIDGTDEIGQQLTQQKTRLDDENVRYAANPTDIEYVNDLSNPRTRFMLLYKLLGDKNQERSNSDGFSRWNSLLDDAEQVEEKAKEAAAEEDAAQKTEIAEKKKLREKFEKAQEVQAVKLNELAARIQTLENVAIGRTNTPITSENGEKALESGALVLVVDKFDEFVDDDPSGEQTMYRIYCLDRRKSKVSDAFAAEYGKLTVPYAPGKIKPTKTIQDLEESQRGFLSNLLGLLSDVSTDEQDYEDTTTDRGELTDLKVFEVPGEYVIPFNQPNLSVHHVLSLNPAVFKEYVGIMNPEEIRRYGGGENEYFEGYMNGIDFGAYILKMKERVQQLNKQRLQTLRNNMAEEKKAEQAARKKKKKKKKTETKEQAAAEEPAAPAEEPAAPAEEPAAPAEEPAAPAEEPAAPAEEPAAPAEEPAAPAEEQTEPEVVRTDTSTLQVMGDLAGAIAEVETKEQAAAGEKSDEKSDEIEEPPGTEFEELDTDKNNEIDVDELSGYMRTIGEIPGKAFLLLEKYDGDKNFLLNNEEFKRLAAAAADQHADYRVGRKVAQWLGEGVFKILETGNDTEIPLDGTTLIEYWDRDDQKWEEVNSLDQFKRGGGEVDDIDDD